MKLTFDELILVNNAKRRLKLWCLFRMVFLIIPVTLVSISIYFLIIAKNYSASLFFGSISGFFFRFIFSNWNGLKKDILLSKIEESN